MANRLSAYLVVGLAVGFAGCGGDSITLPPTTGTLEITAQTSGPAPDADGYAVSLDGTDRGAIGSNAAVTVPGLTPGSHVAGLTGVDANCQVQGDNLRVITIEAGQTVSLTFLVSCAEPPPVVGVLRVTTTTTGQDIDPDGYGFAVDGAAPRPIGINGTDDLANTAVGPHTVVLSNVAPNCTVDDDSQSTIVTPGATATVAFRITCSSAGPTTGSIRITTATSGENQDADGYQFAIDNGGNQSIGVSANQTVGSIPPGSHTVDLKGVADNCTVNDASQGVTVTAGQTADVNFSIICVSTGPTTGSIQVTTTTTGADQDGNGYQFTVDGGGNQPIGLNESKNVDNLPAGSHTVVLSDVAQNCRVDDGSQSVNVPAGGSAPINFTVTCDALPPATGTLRVSTRTTGFDQDDSYSFSVDDGSDQSIGSNDDEDRTVAPGSHTVELSGIAENCEVDDDSQQTNVPAGGTGTITFSITCEAVPPPNQAPVAVDDAYQARVNETLVIPDGTAPGLLFNDTDPEVQQLRTEQTTDVRTDHGSVSVGPDGSFTYNPDLNYVGLDQFTYTVLDPGNLSDIGTVIIDVRQDLGLQN